MTGQLGVTAQPGVTEQLRKVRIPLLTAVAMIFIFVSSGAFGIEDMVSWSGPGLTLVMLILLPVFWAMPMALVCSELGSALPEEGGYYVWTRRALGEFWGFQCGWWSWTCQWVDSAVYIALIQVYVSGWWPQLNGWEIWGIGALLIAVFAYTNIRGLNIIAISSVLFTIIIVAPFLVLIVLGFTHWHVGPFQPFVPHGQSIFSSLNLGLAVGVWMYSGYDSMSTIAGEMERPRFIIPRALMIAMPIIVALYVLPTLVGLAGWDHWASWGTDTGMTTFVSVARDLGGPILGYAMLGAAVISNMALYQDYLTSGSRPAYAMAEDNLLPRSLSRAHRKYGTPFVSILFLAGLNLVLIIGSFANLVVIDVFLNMLYYLLIFAAAIRLRQKEPDLERPFRIWGGTGMLVAICAPAIFIAFVTLYTNAIDTSTTIFGHASFSIFGWTFGWYGIGGVIAMLAGPVAYLYFKHTLGGGRPSPRA
ncbi:MAG TPA: APC family permease [Thermoleophilia bacterium]|nr:APC family permease [Thermoleophilia bacterium]